MAEAEIRVRFGTDAEGKRFIAYTGPLMSLAFEHLDEEQYADSVTGALSFIERDLRDGWGPGLPGDGTTAGAMAALNRIIAEGEGEVGTDATAATEAGDRVRDGAE